MACRFEVTLPPSTVRGVSLANDALAEVEALESRLSIFKDESAVSTVNRDAWLRPVKVDQQLFALLTLCQQLNVETEGAFDITSGPLTRCWGFLKRAGRFPADDEIASARAQSGSDKLLLDTETQTVRFKAPGVEINLGSIGKGYALDVVGKLFEDNHERALLSAGNSSFRATGEAGWLVGLRHPRDKSKRFAAVRMRGCAMSTSGSEEQFFDHDGRRFGHIIDPRSGWPASIVSSVTVVANSAAVSDALATAFFIGGRSMAERYCEKHRDVLAIVLEEGAKNPVLIGAHDRCTVEWC